MKELRPHQIEALVAMNEINEGIIHLPTGTGKTFIQATAIKDSINDGFEWAKEQDKNSVPVYAILSPRIILSNQLYNEVKQILAENKQDCQYLIVHSGRTKDTKTWDFLPFRELMSTTRVRVIKETYEKAVAEQVPLIIIGTYDSAERIVQSEIPVYMVLNDEAQYLVSEEFGWIPKENENPNIKQFNTHRKYYFTATLKETASDEGIGMNNEKLFGPIIYSKTPVEMIQQGEIVRPRVHLVSVEKRDDMSEIDIDANSVRDSFIEHRAQCNVGAKLLVVTKGSEHLNDLVQHPVIQDLLYTRPNLKVFDISSAFQPRINGEIVSREKFLSELQSLSDLEEAIIFHINILSEGIDVPGITGVMIMNNMKLSKFLQTLGRATRLYLRDRLSLYDGKLQPNELNRFVKPYAWVIIPVNDVDGEDLRAELMDIIYALRSYGFKASEDVVIKKLRGTTIPQPLAGINEVDRRAKFYHDILLDVVHNIESEEEANRLAVMKFKIENIANELKFDEDIEEEFQKYFK